MLSAIVGVDGSVFTFSESPETGRAEKIIDMPINNAIILLLKYCFMA